MEGIKERIINLIKTNRISTTEVADCLGKKGLLENARPINRGMFRVGNVKWVYAYNESNWSVHEQVRDVEKDDIVLIEAFHCGERATIGELVTKFIILYRQATAIISNGNMRDANDLIKEKYPVWCKGVTPIGCFNTKNDKPLDPVLYEEHYNQYEGSVAVCDDSGVVIIPKECHTEEFYQKLVDIENQEDIWFDCLDRKKWDTYDIVCLKKYRKDELGR